VKDITPAKIGAVPRVLEPPMDGRRPSPEAVAVACRNPKTSSEPADWPSGSPIIMRRPLTAVGAIRTVSSR
jgi:hypothetical protein